MNSIHKPPMHAAERVRLLADLEGDIVLDVLPMLDRPGKNPESAYRLERAVRRRVRNDLDFPVALFGVEEVVTTYRGLLRRMVADSAVRFFGVLLAPEFPKADGGAPDAP